MVALIIAYLPTMYSAFSRREAAVTLLDVRAGKPPSAVQMILRYHRNHGLDSLHSINFLKFRYAYLLMRTEDEFVLVPFQSIFEFNKSLRGQMEDSILYWANKILSVLEILSGCWRVVNDHMFYPVVLYAQCLS